jgi:AAA15 family ATPase/GTPase
MSELLLDSLEIKGYRCFEHLTIEKLGRVNLIVGKNNVGKTALLEALWLYFNQGSGQMMGAILANRYEDKLPVSFSGNASITYKNLFTRDITESTFQINSINQEIPPLIGGWINEMLQFSSSPPSLIKNFFVKTEGLTNTEITTFWDNIELKPAEDAVIRSMRLILPNLIRVRLKTMQHNERIAYAQIENLEEPFTLKSFGDGLNRLFGISLALANCKDGVLLIDEIENGFHYSILPDVWKLIFKTAKDLNVQVFATTHSKDCIEAFTQAAIDDEESEGMLIRLERNKGDKIIAKTIEEERLADAINYGAEVR